MKMNCIKHEPKPRQFLLILHTLPIIVSYGKDLLGLQTETFVLMLQMPDGPTIKELIA